MSEIWYASSVRSDLTKALWKLDEASRAVKERESLKGELETLNQFLSVVIEKALVLQPLIKKRLEEFDTTATPEQKASAVLAVAGVLEAIATANAEKDEKDETLRAVAEQLAKDGCRARRGRTSSFE
jgi:hypothetical protein